jgi:hypothetical protein
MGTNNSARRALLDKCNTFRRRKNPPHTENADRIYAGVRAADADFKDSLFHITIKGDLNEKQN